MWQPADKVEAVIMHLWAFVVPLLISVPANCAMRAQSTASLPARTPSPLETDPHANLRKCVNIENMCWSLAPRGLMLWHETRYDAGLVKSRYLWPFKKCDYLVECTESIHTNGVSQNSLSWKVKLIVLCSCGPVCSAAWNLVCSCVYIGIRCWDFGPM